MAGGRTLTIIHKGERVTVVEGQDGTVELRFGPNGDERIRPKAKGYRPACREAMTWMLNFAGEMKGDYTR